MSVNPNNTRLRCRYDNFNCTLDPNDGIFFRVMVRALRGVGANGHLYAFGQSNGADWAQRLGVPSKLGYIPRHSKFTVYRYPKALTRIGVPARDNGSGNARVASSNSRLASMAAFDARLHDSSITEQLERGATAE